MIAACSSASGIIAAFTLPKRRFFFSSSSMFNLEEEETCTESDDGGINMPATMSQKDKFNCPNTSTDKCPPVQRIQNLVFGLTEANPN